MKVLVHACCAPCLAYPREALVQEGYEPIGFWYSPNIHPYQEYQKRLHEIQRFSALTDMKFEYDRTYPLQEWIDKAISEMKNGRSRCEMCYRDRLLATARKAKEMDIKTITTSMLFSPHMDHEAVARIGRDIAEAECLDFLYRDFREGKKRGYDISKEMELYRQGYCGCIFSEKERYCKD